MEGGRGVRMHPGWRSSFPESGQAPGTPSGETCGSGRDRLSLGSSRRCPDGAGGCSRFRPLSEGRGVPGEGKRQSSCRSAGSAKVPGQQLPAAFSQGSSRNSRGRSNSCRIRQLEEGEAELRSL